MRSNQRGLAICAERKAHARVIREGDEIGEGFEGVGGERDARRGFASEELEDLGDFDDGGGRDDGDAEGLGESELETWGGRLKVEQESLMTSSAKKRNREGREGGGEVVCKGCKIRTESVEDGGESSIHYCGECG